MSGSIFDQTETDHMYTAQSGVRSLLLRVIAAEHGPESVAEYPIGAGLRSTAPAPVDSRHGIAAARLIRSTADALLRKQATAARGQGLSWAEVGAALGVTVNEGDSLGEVAFEEVAGKPSMRFDRRVVSWTCASCGRAVADYGPYNNNPADDQEGHEEDCARFAAEWQAHLDWITE